MERYRKKDILDITATLIEANDFVTITVPVEPETLTEVFAHCQEVAMQVGNHLEQVDVRYGHLVKILEHYCENIYQMSVNTQDRILCRRLAKIIRKQLTDFQEGIKNEILENRKEVVFLPYKASMWDSLESVWKTAAADKNTDAYVIPIPYYDRNPDGSFHKEHYEGNLYPDYVPITKYDEYDFERRQPDIIYIHNAYDASNYVTSVHPYFYSSNLKKFTSKLVYIPYFILPEIQPDNKRELESIKHFCLCPGIFNADQVIVQSEDMRRAYINILTEETAKNEVSAKQKEIRKYWEMKIDGSGSPKIDKVLRTKREGMEIPTEWLKIIEKPDGTWKKIIFYNTSISDMLKYNEQMLKKIEDVLRVFYKNRNEVVLLWRPHPLIESTLISMRPHLWEEYKRIRKQYILEGWGIYDDTADIDRAVILSDAYYGDRSSVVQLYQKTGKPAMLQNVYFLGKRYDDLIFLSYTADIIGNNLVLISEFTNSVFLISLTDRKIIKLIRLNGEKDVYCLFLSFIRNSGTLLAVPYRANDFHVVNLESGEQYILNGILTPEEQNIENKFVTTVRYQDKAWIIGEEIQKIIEFDLHNMKIIRSVAYENINGLNKISDKLLWCTDYAVKGETIVLPSRNQGFVLNININSGEMTGYPLNDLKSVGMIYTYHEDIILGDFEGNEYIYNVETQKTKKILKLSQNPFYKCIVAGNRKIYFEYDGSIICHEGDKLLDIQYSICQDLRQAGLKFLFVISDISKIYFQERFSGCIFSIDKDTLVCEQLVIELPKNLEESRKSYLNNCNTMEENVCVENGFVTLHELL